MPSQSVRRRQRDQATRYRRMSPSQRQVLGARLLACWRAEANRRADDLGAPAVWALEAQARPRAMAVDPSGELAGDLAAVCREAVQRVAGLHLAGNSRPRAERSRREARSTPGHTRP